MQLNFFEQRKLFIKWKVYGTLRVAVLNNDYNNFKDSTAIR